MHVAHGLFLKSSWLDISEKSLHAGCWIWALGWQIGWRRATLIPEGNARHADPCETCHKLSCGCRVGRTQKL